MVAEGRQADPLPPRRHAPRGGQRGPGALHEPAERHPRGARRLAPAALHARVHERHELTVGLGVLPLHGAHGRDATPRRRRLLPRHPVGRAVRQAQAAADAAGQLVVVQPEIHGAATVPAATAGSPARGRRRRPATSSVRGSVGRWGRTRPSAAGAALRRRGRRPAAAGASARWTMPTPTSATKVPDRPRRSPGGSDRRPPDGSAGGPSTSRELGHQRRLGQRRRPDGPRAAPTSCRRPTGSTPAGRGGAGRRTGRRSPASHCCTAGRGRVRRITSPRNASVPSEPTSRRQRSKPLTFFTVGPPALTTSPVAVTTPACRSASRTGPRPSRRMPLRPTASTPPTVAPGHSGQRHHLTHLGQRRLELGDGRARPAAHDHLLGLHRLDTGRGPHLPGLGEHRATDVPLRAPADAGHRSRRADLLGEGRQIHAPAGTCCTSPHRLPRGQHLVRVGDAVGIEGPAEACPGRRGRPRRT